MVFPHFSADNPKYRKKGFNRKVMVKSLVQLHTFNKQLVDVAGIHAGKLYLATKEPGELLVTDTEFQQVQPLQVNLGAGWVLNEITAINKCYIQLQ